MTVRIRPTSDQSKSTEVIKHFLSYLMTDFGWKWPLPVLEKINQRSEGLGVCDTGGN